MILISFADFEGRYHAWFLAHSLERNLFRSLSSDYDATSGHFLLWPAQPYPYSLPFSFTIQIPYIHAFIHSFICILLLNSYMFALSLFYKLSLHAWLKCWPIILFQVAGLIFQSVYQILFPLSSIIFSEFILIKYMSPPCIFIFCIFIDWYFKK